MKHILTANALEKLQRFTALKSAPEAIRHEEFEGIDHIVIPIIALVEGVITSTQMDGSSSPPLLVLAKEFAKVVDMWNGRPVVINHPKKGGALVSAGDPEVYEEEVIGTIFNASLLDENKLKVEAWINMEKVKDIGGLVEETINRVIAGEEVEVSTAYFADVSEEEGFFNGEKFEGSQTDIKPDHLAILDATKTGACSWEDGCGAARLNMASAESCPILNSKDEPMKFNCEDCPKEKDKDGKISIFQGFVNKLGKVLSLTTNEELSDSDVRQALSAALVEKGEEFFFIIGVFNTSVVYEKGWSGSLISRDFSISEDGVITLGVEETPVRLVTKVVPIQVNEKEQESQTAEEISTMNKAERIKSLIANEQTQFTEADQSFLEGLNEEQLEKMIPVKAEITNNVEADADAEAEKVKVAEALSLKEAQEAKDTQEKQEKQKQEQEDLNKSIANQKVLSTEEFLNTASPEIKAVLQDGLTLRTERKIQLTKAILGNANNTFTKEQLEAMEPHILEGLYNMSGVVDYAGQVGSSSMTANEDNVIPPPPDAFDLKRKTA